MLTDAVDGRALLGHGGLPLEAFIHALPAELPLSPEIRSRALRERLPDALDRATELLTTTRRYLERLPLAPSTQ